MKSIEYLTQNYATKKLGNDILHGCILELDAMFKEHINKYHFIQYPPKTAKGRFDPDTHLPYNTKPIDDVDGINKPPEEAVRKFMILPDDKPTYCTCGGSAWYPREIDPKGNVYGNPHAVCEECGRAKRPTPTDEELVEKYASIIVDDEDENPRYEHHRLRKVIRQLIAEVIRNKEFKDFCELYKKTYPGDGPSISTSDHPHEEYRESCGCWHCLFLQMKQIVPSKEVRS